MRCVFVTDDTDDLITEDRDAKAPPAVGSLLQLTDMTTHWVTLYSVAKVSIVDGEAEVRVERPGGRKPKPAGLFDPKAGKRHRRRKAR